MATGLVVRHVDGPNKGDCFLMDRKTLVHIGPSEGDVELDRAVRLVGRPLAEQTRAEINTFCALFGIPDGNMVKGVKYFG